MPGLRDRTYVVTGAASGIGRATRSGWWIEGANVGSSTSTSRRPRQSPSAPPNPRGRWSSPATSRHEDDVADAVQAAEAGSGRCTAR